MIWNWVADLTIITIDTEPPIKLAYNGWPSPKTLIASHVPPGYEDCTDPFGTTLHPGDWCADGYTLTPHIEIWPGTTLSVHPNRTHTNP